VCVECYNYLLLQFSVQALYPIQVPAAAPTHFPTIPSPAAPTDCATATAEPAVIAPPFAAAAADIADAAMDPAVIPPAVNPIAPRAAGTATGAAMAPRAPPTKQNKYLTNKGTIN